MHERCSNATHEDTVRAPARDLKGIVDLLGDLLVLEGEQGRDIDAIPRLVLERRIATFDEADMIPLAMRAVIGGNLHQAEWRILILVTGFQKQNSFARHQAGTP